MIIKQNLIALSCAATFSLIASQAGAQGMNTTSPALPAPNVQSMTSATTSPVTASNIAAVEIPAAPAPKTRVIVNRRAPVAVRAPIVQEGPAITLEAPREYVDKFKREQMAIEAEKAPKPLTVVSPEVASRMELVVDASYTSQKNANEYYSFTEKKSGAYLNNDEIDFSKSYVVVAQAYKEDVKLELKDIKETSPTGRFEFDAKPYFAQTSSPDCASVALYLATKNLNNFLFPLNNYKPRSCNKLIMVSDSGTFNSDDGLLINVSPMEQKKDHVIKVDITKDGWATKLQDTIYGQPAHLLMVNNNLDIVVAPQSTGGQFHYAKVQDIDYSTFKMTSPFVFKTRLDKQRTYRAIIATKSNGKLKYYPTTVFVEDLEVQFKNTDSQFGKP